MEPGKDPRTTDTGGHGNPAPPSGDPSKAPGGVGTGTEQDPAKNRPSNPEPAPKR